LALVPTTATDAKFAMHWVAQEKENESTEHQVVSFKVWVIWSLITPRGWLSALVFAYRILASQFPLTRRQGLAFLYIFCVTDCQVKPWYVLTSLWMTRYNKKGELPSGEELVQTFWQDCLDAGFHPCKGGYQQRMVPQEYNVKTKEKRVAALDCLDKYLKQLDCPHGGESTDIISDLVTENKTKLRCGLGGTMVVNLFNLAVFLGLLGTEAGKKRAFDGWVNDGVAYADKLDEMGCTEEKDRASLLKQVARKLNYPGDIKVAEHGLCKAYRKKPARDVYFENQSLFDIKVDEKDGNVVVLEQKWGSSKWVQVAVPSLQD
jgi:hypothetical protein